MPTLFTRIIEGALPGHFVWRDDRAVAFLSINPLREGHTLVVPREEVDHWLDAPEDLIDHLMHVSRRVGRALHTAYGSARVGVMIVGLEVPHLHIHLCPIDDLHDMDLDRAATSVPADRLAAAAGRIRRALDEQGDGAQAVA